jgi:hypothetical protein
MAGTVANQVAFIEIDQVTIEELTAGTDVVGGTPAYGPPVRVPDIMELTTNIVIKSTLREGDAKVKGVFAKVTHATGNVKANSVPVDALAIMVGGTVTPTGATPNQVRTWKVTGNAKGKYFRIKGRAVNVEGIDGIAAGAMVVLPKVKITGNLPLGMAQDYANINTEFTAVATESDDTVLDFVIEETQTDLTD